MVSILLLLLALLATGLGDVIVAAGACPLAMPWGCRCFTPPTIDCTRKDLQALNDTAVLANGYSGISLAHNDLRNLTIGATWMKVGDALKELDLSYNDIMAIEDGAFQDLPVLRTLHLQHNLLRNISANTWLGLASIEVLDLSFNRLRKLPTDVFSSFSHLRVLNLSYNPLQTLNGILTSLVSLEQLNLDTTGLSKLLPHTFTNNSYLKKLDLTGNALKEVPTKSLSVLKKLVYLDLSDNHFEHVRTQAFKGLDSVEELRLDNSHALETIEQHAFDGMSSLRKVSCSFNPNLETIHAHAFQPVKAAQGVYEGQLEEVHLRQNALTTMDQNLLPWMRIRYVDLRENPWNCDCHISWMRKMLWVKLTEGTLAMRCNAPPSLHDQPIQNVDIIEFICDEAHHDALTSIILFLTLFSVVIVILSLISCWKLKAFSKCQAAYQMQYRRVRHSPRNKDNAPTDKLELDEAQDL